MSQESTQPCKTLRDIALESGPYPEDAYVFIREGLENAVKSIHGPMTEAQQVVAQYLALERIDFAELLERNQQGELDPEVSDALEESGTDMISRHVSGQDLCWILRDTAVERWGLLASEVLRHWRITTTRDFGRIVFSLVDNEVMQKEPQDSIGDFTAVYDFDEALDKSYEIGEKPVV